MVYLFILPEWLGWDKGTLVLLTLMCQWLWWEFTMGSSLQYNNIILEAWDENRVPSLLLSPGFC